MGEVKKLNILLRHNREYESDKIALLLNNITHQFMKGSSAGLIGLGSSVESG
jgi:hypothetical protein